MSQSGGFSRLLPSERGTTVAVAAPILVALPGPLNRLRLDQESRSLKAELPHSRIAMFQPTEKAGRTAAEPKGAGMDLPRDAEEHQEEEVPVE